MHKKVLSLYKRLCDKGIRTLLDEPIAPFTTFKIGGKADVMVQADNIDDLIASLELCVELDVPYILIGKGSNILVSDSGVEGAVILNSSSKWKILEDKLPEVHFKKRVESRHVSLNGNVNYHKGRDIKDRLLVRVDSGVRIGALRNSLFKENIYGLEWFVGIPSSVGGALYVNMHGADMYFGDIVYRAKLFDGKKFKIVENSYFNFDYDYSILQETKEVVVWVDLVLNRGDVTESKQLSKQWASQKSFQPQRSAGCIFQNLSKEEMEYLNLPTPSVGYLIDKVLGLKGYSVGGAKISEKHAAFIENTGDASAADVIEIIEKVKENAKNNLGLDLRLEIEFKGEFKNIK